MNSTDASSALEPPSEPNPSADKITTDETSTHHPLPPQTRRPLIILYRHRRDVHSSSSTATGRRPLIILYRHRRDVHSSSSTATDKMSTHRLLKPFETF
ncbi:hypothetical protein HF521_016820 [Silurus meridionalis]|uniref:Uncharacterized protein n=1 Tax=Silurus meridionalis TaxID=175797 RepID=A0A8T0BX79_SILME|nr:hypothetical protein HF521_016820 [Silurus meridionalis]